MKIPKWYKSVKVKKLSNFSVDRFGAKSIFFFKQVWKRFLGLKLKYKILFSTLFLLFIGFLFSLPRPLYESPYSVVVQSANGNLLSATIADDEQWRFPPCDSVPYKFKKALITYEDKRFNYHLGVDIFSTGRAFIQNIKQKKNSKWW